MKRNTKIFIGIAILAVCILTVCVVKTLKDAQDSLILNPSDNTPPPTVNEPVKTELTELVLKSTDLFEVKFDGIEYDAHAYIVQKEIPELHERITKRVNELEEAMNVSETEKGNLLASEQREIRMLEDFGICSYEGDGNFKNGDEITVKCNAEGLKKINIIVESTYSIKVEGLTPYIEPVTETETEQNTIIEIKEEETDYIGYHDEGKIAWIDPKDVDKFNTNELPSTVETAIVFVDTQEEFDLIKSKALKGEIKVDEIQFLFDVYDREDNFTEAKEWKGVAN